MRRSPLLKTIPASICFAGVALGVVAWIVVIAVMTLMGVGFNQLCALAVGAFHNPAISAAAITATVACATVCLFLGPSVIRFVLARRISILIAVMALLLIDPLLGISSVLAVLASLAVVRICYGGVGAAVAVWFDFSNISWSRRAFYTFSGTVLVVAILSMPKLPVDVFSILAESFPSVYGMATVVFALVLCGYFVGNLYFPLIVGSKWAVLAYYAVLWILNPVMFGVMLVAEVFFLWLEWTNIAPVSTRKRSYIEPCPLDSHRLDVLMDPTIAQTIGRR